MQKPKRRPNQNDSGIAWTRGEGGVKMARRKSQISAEEQAILHSHLDDCLQSPMLRESVTFQRFLFLIKVMARKLKSGEDTSAEGAEMRALNPAIKAEMKSMLGDVKPQ